MADFCNCGAELPPDARFCHRCGRPLREEPVREEVLREAPVIVPPPAVRPPPPRLNFHNATAVRIGLLLASIASLLSALPVWAAGLLGLVLWWLTTGFLSVYIYRRRTGQFLSVDSGLRMGWITGLLGSTISSVLFTVSVVPLIHSGTIASIYKEQLHTMAASDANVQEALRVLQSPGGLTMFVIMALLFLFLIITFLCTAGGALGAKLVGGIAQPRA
ncbi:MAG TPA: zinc ribbon domain-containing protein [Bryobacteraceae bacterium]|nr:zinc ribbon domain-containing protein [Bryobacteraceae bacterium]